MWPNITSKEANGPPSWTNSLNDVSNGKDEVEWTRLAQGRDEWGSLLKDSDEISGSRIGDEFLTS